MAYGKKIMITVNPELYETIKENADSNSISMSAYCNMLISQKMQIDKDNEAFKKALPEAFKELAKNQRFVDLISEKINEKDS
jgi:hypothetical protein